MQIKYIPPPSGRPPGLLGKTAAAIATVALAGVALMFSAVILTAILIIAIVGGAYLWWKTREVRRLMREQMKGFPPPDTAMESEVFEGTVIEGESVRVEEPGDKIKR